VRSIVTYPRRSRVLEYLEGRDDIPGPTLASLRYLAGLDVADVPGSGLTEAWAEANAALPEGVGLSLHKLALDDWAEAVAEGSGEHGIQFVEQGSTPADALRALVARLRGTTS
jgi:hypothetical protein